MPVTKGHQVMENATLVIADGKIKDILQADEDIHLKYQANKIIDAEGMLVMPGLINTHTHAAMTLFRGVADDLPLQTWLQDHIWPLEARFGNAESVALGTRLAIAEMIRSGTTTFSDMYFFEDEVARAALDAGIRVIIGEGLLDFPTPSIKNPDEGSDYVEAMIKKWKGEEMVGFTVSPHSPYAVSGERIKSFRALAEKHEVPLHIHLSETKFEVEESQKKHQLSPVEYLDTLGVLDENVYAAHCVHLSEKDKDILAKRGVGVSHNPQSNMKLASGIAPVQDLLDRGVVVGLGTDGTASNNNLNMFEEMDVAAKLQKVFTLNAEAINAQTAVEMATINGAKLLGLEDKTGSLEIGKQADIIIIDLHQPQLVPLYHPYSHIVYAMNGSEVNTSIINGKVVMENRKLTTIDEEDVMEKARVIASQIKEESIKSFN